MRLKPAPGWHLRQGSWRLRQGFTVTIGNDTPAREPGILDSSAVHALRNYLAAILGYVELALEDTAAADPRRNDLLAIKNAADAAEGLLKAEL